MHHQFVGMVHMVCLVETVNRNGRLHTLLMLLLLLLAAAATEVQGGVFGGW